jgi:ATP-dependent DNA helicase RecG
MTPEHIKMLLAEGEGLTVEFKECVSGLSNSVYETVCSFSNREGGHLLLGVNDSGVIIDISPNVASRIKSEFVTTINNPNKIYPPLYLIPETIEVDGKAVIYIHVPVGTQVYRVSGRIMDRIEDSDIDITNNSDAVYQLYARKQGSYYVNTVTGFTLSGLRPDLIDRARKMSRLRREDHPWLTMTDEELLRNAGLILSDPDKQMEGITIAAILLFGTDSTIMAAVPQHKTDAIFRVENVDRYDDRDVIITNLYETYDRLMKFGEKHLSNPFVLEGINSVSARDKILREIFSNSLAHRDYSSGYVAKFVIETDRMYTENANRSQRSGIMDLKSFVPFAKNPSISRVFRETSLADELGSGMRNTYKYTELYSGQYPQFIEGDVFRTIVPLTEVAIGRVGPQVDAKTQDNPQVSQQDNPQVSPQVDNQNRILSFCVVPRSKAEIVSHCGYKDRHSFTVHYLQPLLDAGLIQMTIPNKPRSRSQRYVSTQLDLSTS